MLNGDRLESVRIKSTGTFPPCDRGDGGLYATHRMNLSRADWPFLEDAWRFALVLTGTEDRATHALRRALGDVSGRTEASEPETARRLVFARLYRNHHKESRQDLPEEPTPAEERVRAFHHLDEPGRSALALLTAGQFHGEELATLLGTGEAALTRALESARENFAEAAP